MIPARRPDWQARLAAWLADVARTPFAEGAHDCALFAAGAVAAMTGVDPSEGFRGRYTTTRGGLRILRRAGHADHLALATALLPEIDPPAAGAGDLAALAGPEGPALGVVQGPQAVYVAGPSGVALAARAMAVRAWRV